MTSNIEVTISLNELGLEDEDLQAEAQNLLPQLREVDGIETADLVTLVNAPQGTKRELNIEASSKEEFEFAKKQALEFLNSKSSS